MILAPNQFLGSGLGFRVRRKLVGPFTTLLLTAVTANIFGNNRRGAKKYFTPNKQKVNLTGLAELFLVFRSKSRSLIEKIGIYGGK